MMRGVEWRCLREHLALPVEWMAQHLEISERTIRRWEQDTRAVPSGVEYEMLRINGETHAYVVDLLMHVSVPETDPVLLAPLRQSDVPANPPHVGVHLQLPASWWRRVVARVLDDDRFVHDIRVVSTPLDHTGVNG